MTKCSRKTCDFEATGDLAGRCYVCQEKDELVFTLTKLDKQREAGEPMTLPVSCVWIDSPEPNHVEALASLTKSGFQLSIGGIVVYELSFDNAKLADVETDVEAWDFSWLLLPPNGVEGQKQYAISPRDIDIPVSVLYSLIPSSLDFLFKVGIVANDHGRGWWFKGTVDALQSLTSKQYESLRHLW